MSQKYKFKSSQFVDDTTATETQTPEELTTFEIGDARTIDFVLKDGIRQNFSYSHYLTAWLGKEKGERVVKIVFATHKVTIHGIRLDDLYDGIITFSVNTVKAQDERYKDISEEGKTYVTDIDIVWKSDEEKEIKQNDF